jgi:alpha-methylacyl-CoA racemase
VTPVDRTHWDELQRRLAAVFRTRTRDEWGELLEDTDGCFSPVLGLGEVAEYPHHRARGSFPVIGGIPQPAPAPRFSRTRPAIRSLAPEPGEHTIQALQDWGFDADELEELGYEGAIR